VRMSSCVEEDWGILKSHQKGKTTETPCNAAKTGMCGR